TEEYLTGEGYSLLGLWNALMCERSKHSQQLAALQAELQAEGEPYSSLGTFLANESIDVFSKEQLDRIGTLIMEHLLSDNPKVRSRALFISRLCRTAEESQAEKERLEGELGRQKPIMEAAELYYLAMQACEKSGNDGADVNDARDSLNSLLFCAALYFDRKQEPTNGLESDAKQSQFSRHTGHLQQPHQRA